MEFVLRIMKFASVPTPVILVSQYVMVVNVGSEEKWDIWLGNTVLMAHVAPKVTVVRLVTLLVMSVRKGAGMAFVKLDLGVG